MALGLLLAAAALAAYDDARGHGAGTFPGEPLLLGVSSVAAFLGLGWVGRRLFSKRGAA